MWLLKLLERFGQRDPRIAMLEAKLTEARDTVQDAMFALGEAWPYVHGATVTPVREWNRRAKDRCLTTLSPELLDVFVWESGQWCYRNDMTPERLGPQRGRYRLLGVGSSDYRAFFENPKGYVQRYGTVHAKLEQLL